MKKITKFSPRDNFSKFGPMDSTNANLMMAIEATAAACAAMLAKDGIHIQGDQIMCAYVAENDTIAVKVNGKVFDMDYDLDVLKGPMEDMHKMFVVMYNDDADTQAGYEKRFKEAFAPNKNQFMQAKPKTNFMN